MRKIHECAEDIKNILMMQNEPKRLTEICYVVLMSWWMKFYQYIV